MNESGLKWFQARDRFVLPMVFRQHWRVEAHAAFSDAILHDRDDDVGDVLNNDDDDGGDDVHKWHLHSERLAFAFSSKEMSVMVALEAAQLN